MVKLEPHKTALIVVNMQEGLLEEAEAAGIDTEELTASIGAFVSKARGLGALVIMAASIGGGVLDSQIGRAHV